jgi:hypothetical protein
VLLGVIGTAGGAVEFRRFCRTLGERDRPGPSTFRYVLILSWIMVAIGALLAVELLM